MRKPTRPLARRIDERQPAPYQQRSPEPIFCNEHERCQGCPYPRHGIVCWHRDGTCLRTDMVKALNTDIDARYRKTKLVQYLCGIFTVTVALAIHLWSATLAWFAAYLGPRIGSETAVTAVTAYQDDMLVAILPMYFPMVLFIGIHFGMLLIGKTRYPRWMLAFHPVTWNILLVAIPDIAQAMQIPAATWMSVMSQSSTNTAIVIWCIAAAVYEKKHM